MGEWAGVSGAGLGMCWGGSWAGTPPSPLSLSSLPPSVSVHSPSLLYLFY